MFQWSPGRGVVGRQGGSGGDEGEEETGRKKSGGREWEEKVDFRWMELQVQRPALSSPADG